MNSLEFIEKEIELLKARLELDDVLCELSDNDYKFCKDRLQTLQQIQTKLKAWEVVKDNVNVYSHQGCNNVEIEYVQITEEQLPDYKHVDIIKKAKALEMRDE